MNIPWYFQDLFQQDPKCQVTEIYPKGYFVQIGFPFPHEDFVIYMIHQPVVHKSFST